MAPVEPELPSTMTYWGRRMNSQRASSSMAAIRHSSQLKQIVTATNWSNPDNMPDVSSATSAPQPENQKNARLMDTLITS